MNCPKCGARNDDSARFCNACGNRLSSPSSQGTHDDKSKDDGLASFEGALYQVLTTEGPGILKNSRRFIGLVSDLCEHSSSEYKVFVYNCSDELLAPFTEALGKETDAASLDEAANRAILVLYNRSIEAQYASSTVICIRNAIARTMGVEVLAPQPAQATTPPIEVASTQFAPRPQRSNQISSQFEQSSVHEEDQSDRMEPQAAAPAARMTYQNPEPPKRAKTPVGLIALLIVLVMAVGAAGYIVLFGSEGSPLLMSSVATISYSGGGGTTGSMGSAEVKLGDEYTLPKCSFKRSGYEFRCWRDQDGDTFDPGETLTVNNDEEFVAQWSKTAPQSEDNDESADDPAPTYVIISYLGGDGATGVMGSNEVEVGDEYTLPKCNFERSGYEFRCWEDQEGDTWEPGDTRSAYGDMYYTAQWSEVAKKENPPKQEDPPKQENPPATSTDPEPTQSSSKASSFSNEWSGTYDGRDNDDQVIERQLLFDFSNVSDSGEVSGVCYVGVAEQDPDATHGSFNVEGTIDWDSGSLHLWQTSWIDQGGLGPEREFEGTVDFASGTMSGYLSTKGANVYDIPWRCSATNGLDWRT